MVLWFGRLCAGMWWPVWTPRRQVESNKHLGAGQSPVQYPTTGFVFHSFETGIADTNSSSN